MAIGKSGEEEGTIDYVEGLARGLEEGGLEEAQGRRTPIVREEGHPLINKTMSKGFHSTLDLALDFETHAQNVVAGTRDVCEGLLAYTEKPQQEFKGD